MQLASQNPIVSLKGVSYSYGENLVLNNINLDIHGGDYVGIIGPNGGGKTTLIKLILGLIKPDSGTITIFDKLVQHFSNGSRVGFVAQRATNFDSKFPVTVSDVVAMGLISGKGLLRQFGTQDTQKIEKALSAVAMLEYKDKLIGNLSGGQQQRVFIARSIVASPEIIFLDEPTAGVDVRSQDEFYRILKTLNQDLGITLVLVSHDIEVISKEVNELVCVNQNLVYHGTPKGFEGSQHQNDLYHKGVRFIVHRHHD